MATHGSNTRIRVAKKKRTKACNCIGLVNDQLHSHNARIARNFYLNGHLTEPMVTLERIDEKKRV